MDDLSQVMGDGESDSVTKDARTPSWCPILDGEL